MNQVKAQHSRRLAGDRKHDVENELGRLAAVLTARGVRLGAGLGFAPAGTVVVRGAGLDLHYVPQPGFLRRHS